MYVPTPRSAMKVRREIQGKLGRKELYIVERIAPKTITTKSRFPTLEDRMKTFRGGQLWKRCSLTSPFTNMRKPALVKELQSRGHSTTAKSKTELQED